MKALSRLLVTGLILGLCGPVIAAPQPNLLKDPGFDEGMLDTPFSRHWVPFGQAHCESLDPRSGAYCAKLYGNFKNEQNWSGLYQDVHAVPGRRYIGSAYLRQNSGDRLDGGNVAWIKLEFYDSKENQLKVSETPVKMHAKSAANRYLFFSTAPVVAPEKASVIRFVVLFEQQEDNANGSVIVDDASLREIQ